jgi:hypothetical protein
VTRRELAERAAAGDVEAGRELGRLVMGSKIGAPRLDVDMVRANKLHDEGMTWKEVAVEIGVSRRTLDRERKGQR